MVERSKRHFSRHERDQAGCLSGLISIFDFRQDQTTKRLLSDRTKTNKQAVGAVYSSTQTVLPDPTASSENTADHEESKMSLINTAKTSVKKLMEEEMFDELGPTNQLNDSEIDFQIIIKELADIYNKNTSVHGDLDEEKLIEDLKLFVEQRKLGCSKEFIIALQKLSKNRSLFFKLLQDRNSVLAQNIDSVEDARLKKDVKQSPLPGPTLSNEKSVNSDERQHRNFFRRRNKSMDTQYSDTIMILKPGSSVSRSTETDIRRNTFHFSFTEIRRKLWHAMGKERPGISRDGVILISSKHQNIKNGEKGSNGENFGWSSPNRNHFYTEKFTKPLKDKVSGMMDEMSQNTRPAVTNIYIESKKYLSEILNDEENAELTKGKSNKSLGRILSFSDYDYSTCCSPREDGHEIFITAKMRLSPHGVFENNNMSEISQENHWSPSLINLDDKAESHNADVSISFTNEQKIVSLNEDSTILEVESSSSIFVEIEETRESKSREEEMVVNVFSESDSNSMTEDIQSGGNSEVDNEEMEESKPHEEEKISNEAYNNSMTGDRQNGDIRKVDNEEIASECLKDSPRFIELNLLGEDQILSSQRVTPSCSPESKEVEDSEDSIDKIDQPSPISVLEPLFTDDDISPARTISQPVVKEIHPRHINFGEQFSEETCIRISSENEESAFEYVEAVLLGSDLNWDEFLLRWLSFYEILDSSLFEEVELFSSRSHSDQRLLFDCANEALMEVCECYFGCFTGIKQQNIQQIPKGMDLINDVWERVERDLFQHISQVNSLDHLVKKNMPTFGKWMNLQSDFVVIGFEMGEIIFDELVEEVVLSFVDDDDISETDECYVIQEDGDL